jgi:hypothetical protein
MTFSEQLDVYNEAVRYMEWEERYRPRTGDPRTPLQRRLDGLSLAEGWNQKTKHDLRMKAETTYGCKNLEAKEKLKTGSYKAKNPYKDGGDSIVVGNYIFDEYGFLVRFEGWYFEGFPIFATVDHVKTLEEAWEIASEEGERLFSKVGKTYSEIDPTAWQAVAC